LIKTVKATRSSVSLCGFASENATPTVSNLYSKNKTSVLGSFCRFGCENKTGVLRISVFKKNKKIDGWSAT